MDFLLIIYILLFIGILIFPFGYYYWQIKTQNSHIHNLENQKLITLKEKKLQLLGNLKDLKAEWETGKLTHEEFKELSKDIILQLNKIDEEIQNNQHPSSSDSPPHSNLNCPSCGTPKIPNANFCHHCGFSFAQSLSIL